MSRFRLPELPETFATTRDHLHQLAFFAVSPARHKAAGRMGLHHHSGGFRTPEFDGRHIRVEGDLIVVYDGDSAASQTISTVREAIEFLGHEYETEWFPGFHDPLAPLDPEHRLDVDPVAAHVISEWFAFAWVVLEELRGHGQPGDEVSEVQLWPEHFDAATELGDHENGQRASFGASPGVMRFIRSPTCMFPPGRRSIAPTLTGTTRHSMVRACRTVISWLLMIRCRPVWTSYSRGTGFSTPADTSESTKPLAADVTSRMVSS